MQPIKPVTFAFALALAAAQSARAGAPSFHHHDHDAAGEEQDHYKNESEKPSKAQVGKTLFQSRALLGKDGVTVLEVTTGKLDSSATPPGYLSEVHVKALRADGKHQFEKEFEHLRSGGGYASFSFPLPATARRHDRDDDDAKDTRLEHGQLLKLHVEGKGLASGDEGEAEAKLQDTVLYRPDLTVTSLHYPAAARVKTAVEVSASVIEQMRDTGAHADCVLSVDGSPVDKAPGIWVDRNGAVSCHFAYTFTTVGKHALNVAVQNVAPGDYDNDNNSLGGTIQIDSPSLMAYYASATDLTNSSQFVRDVFATSTSTVPDQHFASTFTMHTQSRTLTGTIPAAVNLPLNKATYADQSDGAPVSSVAFANLSADSTVAMADPTYDTVATISRVDNATGGWFTLRRYSNSSTGAGATNVSWSFFGGDVTYHSESYCNSVAGIFACAGGDWTMNSGGNSPIGSGPVTLGKSYAADAVIDDGTAYQAHPSMALTTQTNNSSAPQACRQMTLNGTPVKVCMQSTASSTVTAGSTLFTPPQ